MFRQRNPTSRFARQLARGWHRNNNTSLPAPTSGLHPGFPEAAREGSQAPWEPSPRPYAPSGTQPSPPALAATSQPAASGCAVTAEKEILLRNLALRELFHKQRKLNQTKPRSHAEPVPLALSTLSGGRGCSLDPPGAPLTCVAARRQRAVWSCTWV